MKHRERRTALILQTGRSRSGSDQRYIGRPSTRARPQASESNRKRTITEFTGNAFAGLQLRPELRGTMGSRASKEEDKKREDRQTSSSASHKFRAQDLRAPIFGKHQPEKIDLKANHKYCSEEIIKSWFRTVDVDGSGDITYEEYRQSQLANNVPEEVARERFNQMDLDGNRVIDFEEFRTFHLKAGLPEPGNAGSLH